MIGTYRSERPGLEKLKISGAELHRCDFHDERQIPTLVHCITRRHKKLRAIIHNASDWLPDDHGMPVSEIIHRMMQVHVSAPYQLNLSLAPLLEASENDHADITHVEVNSPAPALVLFNEDDDDEYRHKALGKSLMQREAGFEEFQHAVDYMLGSGYVTGRVLPMDGGRHLR